MTVRQLQSASRPEITRAVGFITLPQGQRTPPAPSPHLDHQRTCRGGGRGDRWAHKQKQKFSGSAPWQARKASNPKTNSAQNLRVPQIRSLFHPFTSGRFHALLNSLFKVLFNFPSRYLFAIGLVVVFSLRWNLAPALSCTPKQLDSQEKTNQRQAVPVRAFHPLWVSSRIPTDFG